MELKMKNMIFKNSYFKVSLIIVLMFFTIISCKKEDNRAQDEITAREQYIKDNNISATPTASGLYYIETLEGTGAAPTTGMYVKIVLDMQYLSGESIIADTIDLGYGNLILGLDETLSYMKEGGKATAIVPSELAYGSSGSTNIPAYTTLIFKLELLEVYNPVVKEAELIAQYVADKEITTQPTTSGLYYIETLEGAGSVAQDNQTATVNYTGRYLNGEVFDSGTFSFVLGAGKVIAGFDEGVGYMKKGGKATLIVPSKLAYGTTGFNSIQPYTPLVFDIELTNLH